MFRTKTSRLWLAGVVASLVVAVPASRGPVLLAVAAAVLIGEWVRARANRGRAVELLVDGEARRVPAAGGFVRLGDAQVDVRRIGDAVSVDGEVLPVGGLVFRGSAVLEVVR